jgi:hypothetical protein
MARVLVSNLHGYAERYCISTFPGLIGGTQQYAVLGPFFTDHKHKEYLKTDEEYYRS